jgi:hypothetical protein
MVQYLPSTTNGQDIWIFGTTESGCL